MSETRILAATRTHSDDDGDLLPEFGSGVDAFSFTIPAGKRYARHLLKKLNGTSLFAGCQVTSAPAAKAAGSQSIKVKWGYEILGSIRYGLEVFVEPEGTAGSTLVIDLGQSDWFDEAMQAIQQKKDFKLAITGKRAAEMWAAIKSHSPIPFAQAPAPGTVAPLLTGVEVVAVTIAICMAVISVAALATIMTVAIVAINQGYDVTARHEVKGPTPVDDRLEIIVTRSKD